MNNNIRAAAQELMEALDGLSPNDFGGYSLDRDGRVNVDAAMSNVEAALAAPASDLHAGSIDTPEFRAVLSNYNIGNMTEAALITHIDRHTREAVRAADKEARSKVARAFDLGGANFAWSYLLGLIEAAVEADEREASDLTNDQRDAARYRWLRDSGQIIASSTGKGIAFPMYTPNGHQEDLNAAIDRAILATKKEQANG